MSDFQSWIGKSETVDDIASPAPLAGLAALLDHAPPPWPEGVLPPLAHWLYFLPRARQSDLDMDGHPKRGGFLPPIALPRRMWAGSRIAFHAPVKIGAAIARRSTIAAIADKSGTSGAMIFVTLRHDISCGGGLAIREEQDVVFREAPKPGAPSPARKSEPRSAQYRRVVTPDPALLFRFSALTFNAHRIHYDRDYARNVEGYPGLVVQGPLTALLLMDHALRNHSGAKVARFSFRAQSPLFDGAPFALCESDDGALWAERPDGQIAMTAEIEFR